MHSCKKSLWSVWIFFVQLIWTNSLTELKIHWKLSMLLQNSVWSLKELQRSLPELCAGADCVIIPSLWHYTDPRGGKKSIWNWMFKVVWSFTIVLTEGTCIQSAYILTSIIGQDVEHEDKTCSTRLYIWGFGVCAIPYLFKHSVSHSVRKLFTERCSQKKRSLLQSCLVANSPCSCMQFSLAVSFLCLLLYQVLGLIVLILCLVMLILK